MRIYTILKLIINKLLTVINITSVDYIVEQKTSGIWTYRKWNSGICEAYGSIASKTYSLNKATGHLYYADGLTQSIPSGIFKTIKQIQPTTQATNGIPFVTITGFTTSDITFRLSYAVSSAISITAVVSFEIKGTWK